MSSSNCNSNLNQNYRQRRRNRNRNSNAIIDVDHDALKERRRNAPTTASEPVPTLNSTASRGDFQSDSVPRTPVTLAFELKDINQVPAENETIVFESSRYKGEGEEEEEIEEEGEEIEEEDDDEEEESHR